MHVIVLSSLHGGAVLTMFAAVLVGFGLWGRLTEARNKELLLCFLVVPDLFYFEIRLDQNIAHRFFVFVPVAAAVLLAANWSSIRDRRSMLLRVGVVAWAVLIMHGYVGFLRLFQFEQHRNRVAIAKDMMDLPHGRMLLTEAGILPYYSGWTAYDAWGLNTSEFAKHLIQPSDVAALQPDLIMVHTGHIDCDASQEGRAPDTVRTWDGMTRNLIAGIDRNRYELWMVPYGDRQKSHGHFWQGDQECWYIRKDAASHLQLEAILQTHNGLPEETYVQLVSRSAARANSDPNP
jgi:hypothetical protein